MNVAFGALFLSFLASQVSAASGSLSIDLSVPISVFNTKFLIAKGTLKNTGDIPLKIFKDPRSILSAPNDKTTIFQITSGSCRPDFTGISVVYNPHEAAKLNNPEDFLVLPPGHTVNFDHNLGNSYKFNCGPGPYQIEALKTFYHMNHLGALETIEASTKLRVFGITGSRVASQVKPNSPLRKSSSFGKRDAYFKRCDGDQRFMIMDAAIIAGEMVNLANNRITAMKDSNQRYNTWFGSYNKERHSTVQTHFKKIQRKPTTSTYDCRACKSRFGHKSNWMDAYVDNTPGSPKYVYLCERFWKAPRFKPESKPGTIISALLRLAENGMATGYAVIQTEVANLAKQNPEQAVLNAENYRYYAEGYFTSYEHQMRMKPDSSSDEEPNLTSPKSVATAQGASVPTIPSRFTAGEKGKGKVPGSM